MIAFFLFILAGVALSLAAVLVAYANTGEQQTLGGLVAMIGFLIAALGALASVAGV